MAEAEVETVSASKFFCHRCTAEISPKLPDYVCPRCNSGFIEILEETHDSDSDSSTMEDLDLEFHELVSGSPFSSSSQSSNADSSTVSGGASGSSAGPRRSQRFRNTLNPRHGRRRFDLDHRHQALAPILQEVIMQMTSSILGPGVGAELGIFPEGIEIPAFPMLVTSNLASNPGDYAWGRGGLDAIITQLMNQLDGTGPPPLPQEKINQIPSVKITQAQCDKNLQCTVCMEDFNLEELVRKLNCDHCYHDDCIIPWLQLHGTCPICRKTLINDLGGERDSVPFASFGRRDTRESPAPERTAAANRGPESTSSPSRSRSNQSSNNPRLNFMEDDLD